MMVTRDGAMDEVTVQVEFDAVAVNSPESWAARIAHRLRATLGIGVRVEPIPKNALERTDFKARRVIDRRKDYTYRSSGPP
jgi:phenylacetate-CoA ligase